MKRIAAFLVVAALSLSPCACQSGLDPKYQAVIDQLEDGNFFNGKKTISSAVPMALMYFDELGRSYNDPVLLAAAEKSYKKLLDMQILESDDPMLHGAFEGMISSPEDNPRTIVQLRTSAYALIALLKVEGKIRNFWLGGEHNDKFMDPIYIYNKSNPYPFKY